MIHEPNDTHAPVSQPTTGSKSTAESNVNSQSPRWWQLDPGGLIVGLIFSMLSMTPSLLPRPALFQAALAGITFALGYLLGVVCWKVARMLLGRKRSLPTFPGWWWIAYLGAWILAFATLSTLAVIWQNEVRRSVSMPPVDGANITLFVAVWVPTALLFLLIGKAVGAAYRALRRRVTGVIAGGIVTVLVAVLIAVSVFGAVSAVDGIYHARNAHPSPDVQEPSAQYRSAGEGSAVTWDSLGRHGAAFIGGGPSAQQIEALTGEPAIEPIRVYAGLESAGTMKDRADLVVSELERTGAFTRDVLVIATATGSGWLEPQSVDAIEYLYGGNTAIAAMQYAYTPSWVSFVFDPDAPVAAAQMLFAAVEERWLELPVADRPKLIVYGLSLGAHGSQAVFEDLENLRARTDGALFVGSPNGSQLWQTLQRERDAGSPAWQPVLDNGREVRWISVPSDFRQLAGVWETPRVLYLQHPTDPVTWLSPSLLLSSPEWLEADQRSSELSSAMRWIPIVTALQVTIDMLGGEAVPASYGHNYGDVVVTAWQQVVGETALDGAAIARIQSEIASYAPILSFSGE